MRWCRCAQPSGVPEGPCISIISTGSPETESVSRILTRCTAPLWRKRRSMAAEPTSLSQGSVGTQAAANAAGSESLRSRNGAANRVGPAPAGLPSHASTM